jgi:ferritin-like metal-binding protein YciE
MSSKFNGADAGGETAAASDAIARQCGLASGVSACKRRAALAQKVLISCQRRSSLQEDTMKLQSLKDLFVAELRDLYNAENQLVKAIPKMAAAADSEKLQAAFEEHLEQTRNHVSRLETIFERLNLNPKGKRCKGMESIIEEGKDFIEMRPDAQVLDAALIAAAQHVEHYEIAGYGCAKTYANLIGDEEAVRLLDETLKEEKLTDEKLTELAMSGINEQAAEPAPEMAHAQG